MEIAVRPFEDRDRDWAFALLFPQGGLPRIASRGVLHDPLGLPGFVALRGGERIGLVTYRPPEDGEVELLTLDSVAEGRGAGTVLIEAVKRAARAAGAARVWLIATNDNTRALRFYQRRGFRIRDVRPGAVDRARETIKPEIPTLGRDAVPIRDEVEFVIDL